MTNSDFDLPKNSPMMVMRAEDLSVHSVELLKIRLQVLKAEIDRTDQAIVDKEIADMLSRGKGQRPDRRGPGGKKGKGKGGRGGGPSIAEAATG
jgi:uncharacterized small protein (DUF1192 family)